MGASLERTLEQVRACTVCADVLPHGVRPVVQIDERARILIIGHAPGRRVHESGVPFDDPSGKRLRAWLGIDEAVFRSPSVAIMPMGFCYPGTGTSGDLPPRPECAPLWHDVLRAHMPDIALTVLLGAHAVRANLPGPASRTLTAAVQAWRGSWPGAVPLPHPSPRNNRWLARNPWFEAEVLPALQARVQDLLRA